MKSKKRKAKGFTLVEVLLYVGIISALVMVMSSFLYMIMGSRAKSQAISEVETQGQILMQQIRQSIRSSKGINIPLSGTSGQTLSVESKDSLKSPTIFSLSGSSLEIKEGVSPAVSLTSSQVVVSELSFQNVSKVGTGGSIRIQFSLSYASGSQSGEYNYSKTFYGSASLR